MLPFYTYKQFVFIMMPNTVLAILFLIVQEIQMQLIICHAIHANRRWRCWSSFICRRMVDHCLVTILSQNAEKSPTQL